jgi:hypothetical protein
MRVLNAEIKGEVLAKYNVGACTIVLETDGVKTRYLVQEPLLSEEDFEQVNFMIKAFVQTGTAFTPEGVEQFIWKVAERRKMTEYFSKNFQKIKYYIVRETLGYGMIQAPLEDGNVDEIVLSSPGSPLMVSVSFPLEKPVLETNIVLTDDDLAVLARKFAARTGCDNVNRIHGVTEEGFFVYMIRQRSPPLASFTIRKQKGGSIEDLVRGKVLDVKTAAVIRAMVKAKCNILVCGDKKSGKTTIAASILSSVDDSKVMLVEKSMEMRTGKNVIRLLEEPGIEDYILFTRPSYLFADNVSLDFKRIEASGIPYVFVQETVPEWFEGYVVRTSRKNGYNVEVLKKTGARLDPLIVEDDRLLYPYFVEEARKLSAGKQEF